MYKLQVLEEGQFVTYRKNYDMELLLYVADCLADLGYEARVTDEN